MNCAHIRCYLCHVGYKNESPLLYPTVSRVLSQSGNYVIQGNSSNMLLHPDKKERLTRDAQSKQLPLVRIKGSNHFDNISQCLGVEQLCMHPM